MSIINFNAGYIPPVPYDLNAIAAGTALNANLLIDASGEKAACIIRVPKTGTLGKIQFRLSTVTSAQNLKISFQDVSLSTGYPDGTIDQYRVVSSGITSNASIKTGLITSDGTDTGTKRSVTKGDFVAVVFEFDNTVGNLSFSSASNSNNTTNAFPYIALFTSSWAGGSGLPTIALIYDDDTTDYMPRTFPLSNCTNTAAFGNSTSITELGLKFTSPVPLRISGAMLCGNFASDTDVVLYDSDGTTVLATASHDKDLKKSATTNGLAILFSTSVSLSANVAYRLVAKPTTATTITLIYLEVSDVAYWNQMECGPNWHMTTKTSGVWGETTTRRPLIHLLIDGLEIGGSSGGGPIFGGMVVK